MPKIVEARACLADIAVETVRTDAVQSFVKQETVFVDLATDDGNAGTGYAYTIGTGGSLRPRDAARPPAAALIGADATRSSTCGTTCSPRPGSTTVGAITSLALAAVDTALWDLRCLRAGEPLWRLAGGFRLRCRSTTLRAAGCIWTLRTGARGARGAGIRWPGVKLKVGKPHVEQDVERLRAVRDAVGPALEIMVDANQSMTAAEAAAAPRRSNRLAWPGSRSRCPRTTCPGTRSSPARPRSRSRWASRFTRSGSSATTCTGKQRPSCRSTSRASAGSRRG